MFQRGVLSLKLIFTVHLRTHHSLECKKKIKKIGAHEHGDFMPLSSPETLPSLDIPLSSYSDIDVENDRYGREKGFEESMFSSSSYRIDISATSEEYLPMVHS